MLIIMVIFITIYLICIAICVCRHSVRYLESQQQITQQIQHLPERDKDGVVQAAPRQPKSNR